MFDSAQRAGAGAHGWVETLFSKPWRTLTIATILFAIALVYYYQDHACEDYTNPDSICLLINRGLQFGGLIASSNNDAAPRWEYKYDSSTGNYYAVQVNANDLILDNSWLQDSSDAVFKNWNALKNWWYNVPANLPSEYVLSYVDNSLALSEDEPSPISYIPFDKPTVVPLQDQANVQSLQQEQQLAYMNSIGYSQQAQIGNFAGAQYSSVQIPTQYSNAAASGINVNGATGYVQIPTQYSNAAAAGINVNGAAGYVQIPTQYGNAAAAGINVNGAVGNVQIPTVYGNSLAAGVIPTTGVPVGYAGPQ